MHVFRKGASKRMAGINTLSEFDEQELQAYRELRSEGRLLILPSQDAIMDRLCSDYCRVPEESKGVHCYGGPVHMCSDSGECEHVYQRFREDVAEFAGIDLEESEGSPSEPNTETTTR